ncbi:phospholipid-transporting ATPase IF-like isoform X1 [Daphnia magna]|uniref:phospholipid-transporting ATPase IF-like isoform X1 n=1 Tax=Daphnia magna TaxID=35525 RepID=UPI00140289D2|nr:phospholipid-transporting ATPase IF-like isoform X1 [Daphnia magna]
MGWMNHLDRLIRGKQTPLVRNRTINIGRKVHSPLENALSGTSRGEVFVDNRVVSAKYTIWNFIPKNLFEQFRRIANFYFLCIAIIQMSIDSPVNPATSSLPLVFVITVTAIKQGYEDWLRHRNDREVNLRLVDVVHQGSIQQVQSQNIHVGDIVRVKRDESFPCDLVLVSTSNNEGKCYITTANLDGETNLKTHYSPKETRQLKTTEQLSAFSACIECQNPTPDLYKFMGTLKIFGDADIENPQLMTKVSLGLENTLFRGARLKDTEFIYGCAVYTGQDTKMAQNSKLTSNKFSTVEKTMNMFLLFFLSILVIEISVCTALKYKMWFSPTIADAWYLNANHSAPVRDVLQDVFSFLVVFNYIIPISLYVTLEMQKFIGSLFFAWDEELRCPITGEIPICNSSDLNEELGQVQYLFTDKTGTLTENNMEFRQCSIAGLKHMEKEGDLFAALDNSARHFNPVHHFTGYLEEFFVGLALCHTVQVSIPTSSKREEVVSSLPGYVNNTFHPDHFDYTYQASSPDEKALVEACRRLGIVFHGEEDGLIRLTVFGQDRYYRRLQVLEFDSDRKRMSTIVLFPDDSIWLVCKGAESTIVPNCIVGPINQTLEHINDYALLGLRTLAVSARRLTSDQYADMMEKLNEARQVMVDRELCVSRIFDFIESDMTLLGATGVEDQLQDGVAETLEALRAAGIKIWVLTGDKLETAINIAYSCGHFKRGMQLLTLTAQTSPAECQETLWRLRRRIWDEPIQNFGFVVDGESLAHSLKEHRQLLSEVCSHCNTVVCCRMSPIQKAEVVKVVKGFSSKPITAAIGDGANDVSMIQEAHVGIGIMGKEGRQAVRCSDFAFARFRFLRRVLLVHGHWYYWRVSTLVQYFFYKNITFITPAVFFAIFSAYSTQPIYDTFFLTFYNIFFTSWPILIFGLLEQNFTSRQLLENLHLYRDITNNARMSWFQFFKWTLLGLWHSVVIFFGCILLWESETPFDSRGLILDFWSFGTLVYNGVIVVVSLKLVLQSRHWTAPFVISILLSVFGFMGLTFLYCLFSVDALNNGPLKWVYMNMLSTGPVWLFIVFGVVVALLPDILIGVWEAYSAGEGVLVNQRCTPGQALKQQLDRTFSLLSQSRSGKLQVTLDQTASNPNMHQSASYELRVHRTNARRTSARLNGGINAESTTTYRH